MTNKTPLQELIDDIWDNGLLSNSSKMIVCDVITKKLEKEKNIIVEARMHSLKSIVDCEKYYKEKFGQ